ncbi:fimbrial protein [Pseudomonas sp. ITA]|uniref:fimbrial protein n=1 Tax=Pseudomonas sp. ITA TaxID=2825841 RepID=UPI002499075D|nr:fimbrial protein [Pseudomonas sp. ITA]MDI2145868.1 fimbrial protein [Pseudomonas sp. ITA]
MRFSSVTPVHVRRPHTASSSIVATSACQKVLLRAGLAVMGMTAGALPMAANAALTQVMTQRVIVHAIAVASACRVVVEGDSVGSNRLSFGVYNKGAGNPPVARPLTFWLYEEGATIPGCSAFLVSPLASVHFGNPGQLDEAGVTTRGAGGHVRVDIRSTDSQADYRGAITAQNAQVNYPSTFAAQGRLAFTAKPVALEQASAGEYRGTLSFVVTYN